MCCGFLQGTLHACIDVVMHATYIVLFTDCSCWLFCAAVCSQTSHQELSLNSMTWQLALQTHLCNRLTDCPLLSPHASWSMSVHTPPPPSFRAPLAMSRLMPTALCCAIQKQVKRMRACRAYKGRHQLMTPHHHSLAECTSTSGGLDIGSLSMIRSRPKRSWLCM